MKEFNSKKYAILSPERQVVLREKILEFARAHNIPDYMADLFINEVRLTTDEANKDLREKAKLLGLM